MIKPIVIFVKVALQIVVGTVVPFFAYPIFQVSEVIHLKKYSEHKAHYTIKCDTIYAFRVDVTC